MKILFLTITLLAAQLPAYAGPNDGGGGAGICKNGLCITLAEAGFRILTPDHSMVEIPIKTIEELDRINALLPYWLRFHTSDIVGDIGDIVFVEAANKAKIKKFLKSYSDVLIANKSQQFSKNMEILGFTVQPNPSSYKRKTFLLKEKFESLNTRSQALLLRHEGAIRYLRISFEQALKIDGAVVDYLKAVESNTAPDIKSILAQLEGSGMMFEDQRNQFLFIELLRQANISIEDFYKLYGDGQPGARDLYLGYLTLLRLRPLLPEVTNLVKPFKLKIKRERMSSTIGGFGYFLKSYLEKYNAQNVKVTNEQFQSYLAAKYTLNVTETMSKCRYQPVKPGYMDSYAIISTYQGLSDIFVVECNKTDADGTTHPFEAQTHQMLTKNMLGANLNLEAPLICKKAPSVRGQVDTIICN